MNNQRKIAVITDSGTDVPPQFTEAQGVFTTPLTIQYSHGSFLDGVDIEAEQVYAGLEREIPSTSLPTADTVLNALYKIRDAGYEHVFVITISAGLSGTYGMMRMMAKEVPDLTYHFIDTKNIGIGAGLSVVQAVEFISSGLEPAAIEERLIETAANTKVFFSLATLKYLAKGGRLGKVAATVGGLLTIRPVISCNEDGVYYTVQRVRGRTQSLQATVRHATQYVAGHRYNVALAHGGAADELETLKAMASELITGADNVYEGSVSPALGVHTGPGLLGIGVQRIVSDA